MSDRDRGRQKEENGQAAQDALSDDRSERREAKHAHPRTIVASPKPDREYDGQAAYEGGDHPVSVFVENSTDHLIERESKHEMSVGVRPVGDGKPGLRAGHKSSGDDEQESADRGEKRVQVKSFVTLQ